jgi:hypothetical protein
VNVMRTQSALGSPTQYKVPGTEVAR